MQEIQKLAEKAGASITERFGHLMIEVRGIRYVRHARIIELSLKGVEQGKFGKDGPHAVPGYVPCI